MGWGWTYGDQEPTLVQLVSYCVELEKHKAMKQKLHLGRKTKKALCFDMHATQAFASIFQIRLPNSLNSLFLFMCSFGRALYYNTCQTILSTTSTGTNSLELQNTALHHHKEKNTAM